jgi:hypothetical protein
LIICRIFHVYAKSLHVLLTSYLCRKHVKHLGSRLSNNPKGGRTTSGIQAKVSGIQAIFDIQLT